MASNEKLFFQPEELKLPPQYLRNLFPWRDQPESEKLPLKESAFTEGEEIDPAFEALLKTKQAIEEENVKRGKEGKHPVTFVGIHASPEKDATSKLLLSKMLDISERLGVHKELVSLSDEKGNLSPEKIEEAIEKIRTSDGFVLTTNTKRGIFNSYYTALLERLEEEKLSGKIAAFSHTFSDEEKDSQIAPIELTERFLEQKGCFILPYSMMYAHRGEANEKWLERDIERNGVNLVRAMERLSKSEFPDLLSDPEKLEQRKQGGEISQTWKALREKVVAINKKREEKNEPPVNTLFVMGNENPNGYSARATRVLGKNFEYLGLKTDFIQLSEEESTIQWSTGNPEVDLNTVMSEKETEPKKSEDEAMQDAYAKMMAADMIIFASPVRWFEVSARLQKFIERTTPLEISGFLLEGKAFGTLITFAEAGAADAASRLQVYASNNGMMSIPLGGLKFRLGSSPKGKENPTNKDFIGEKRYKSIRKMAASGVALVAELLAADGKDVKKMRWDHLNPLLNIVAPED